MKKLTVLVTGGKAPGFASIVNALRKSKRYDIEIIGTDWKPSISAEQISDSYHVLCGNTEPQFADQLFETAIDTNADVILPIRTFDLMPICKNIRKFRRYGIEVALPTDDIDLLEIAMDKFQLFKYASAILELPVPSSSLVSTKMDLLRAAAALDWPEKKICVKPVMSNGSRGFRVIDEFRNLKELFYNEKPTNVNTTMDQLIAILGKSFPLLQVMDYLPGVEITVDVLCRRGKTFAVVPRFRDRMKQGITVEVLRRV